MQIPWFSCTHYFIVFCFQLIGGDDEIRCMTHRQEKVDVVSLYISSRDEEASFVVSDLYLEVCEDN